MNTMTTNHTATNDSQELLAGAVHLIALFLALSTSWAVGAGGMLAGLGVWLITRNRQELVAAHAAEVFNFSFSLFLYAIAAIVFTIITLFVGLVVTVPVAIVLAIVWIVASIVGAIAGFNGRPFRYPLTIRILRP